MANVPKIQDKIQATCIVWGYGTDFCVIISMVRWINNLGSEI